MSGSERFKDRSVFIRVIGCVLLCAGAFLVIIGPVEIICFPMFWAGGRFHYEGFGFGSFMYGVIAAQIILYPAAGAVLLPLGWGHIRLRRWAGRLSLSLLWAWLAAGAPIAASAAFLAAGTKDLTPASAIINAASFALFWPLLPILLIRFYKGRNAVKTLEGRDGKTYWTDRTPVPVLALCALCALCILIMAISVFYSGIFPLPGIILTGAPGFIAISLSCALLALFISGLLRQKRWAWYGTAALMLTLLVSTLVTYSIHGYKEILTALSFPKTEADILSKLPLQGYHLAVLMSFPYVGGVIAAAISRKHFKSVNQV